MHIIVVPILTDFTVEPMRTASLLHEAVRRLGGDVTITQKDLDHGSVRLEASEEERAKAECMTFELQDFDEKGVPAAVRLRIVDLETAEAINSEQEKIRAEAEERFGAAQGVKIA